MGEDALGCVNNACLGKIMCVCYIFKDWKEKAKGRRKGVIMEVKTLELSLWYCTYILPSTISPSPSLHQLVFALHLHKCTHIHIHTSIHTKGLR